MRISALNSANITRFQKLNTSKNNKTNNFENNVPKLLSYPKVYFTSDITNKKMPSAEFIKLIENDIQRNDVIQVLTDSNNEYGSKNEKLFVATVNKAKKLLKDDEIFYDEQYLPELIEATKLAFQASKDKSGKIIGDINSLGLLSGTAYIGIMNRCDNIPEIFQTSKNNDGTVDALKAEAIINVKTDFNNGLSPQEALEFIKAYSITNDEIDFYKLDSVINLFNAAEAVQAPECNTVYSIILDETGEMDSQKCAFATDAYEKLMNFARKEVGDSEGNIYPGYRFLVGECIRAIIDRGMFINGFNEAEAMHAVDDWIKFISENKGMLDNNLGVVVKINSESKVISINDYALNDLPEKEMYSNNLYRLYSALNVPAISKA